MKTATTTTTTPHTLPSSIFHKQTLPFSSHTHDHHPSTRTPSFSLLLLILLFLFPSFPLPPSLPPFFPSSRLSSLRASSSILVRSHSHPLNKFKKSMETVSAVAQQASHGEKGSSTESVDGCVERDIRFQSDLEPSGSNRQNNSPTDAIS